VQRANIEEDPAYQQIIPYCMIRDTKGRFLIVRRKEGGEKRLAGKYSMGIGGHINPHDDGEGRRWNMPTMFWNCALRELKEELGGDFNINTRAMPLGWVKDDTNEVGSVHAGYVILVQLIGDVPDEVESDELAGGFRRLNLLPDTVTDNMESWSRHLLDQKHRLLELEIA